MPLSTKTCSVTSSMEIAEAHRGQDPLAASIPCSLRPQLRGPVSNPCELTICALWLARGVLLRGACLDSTCRSNRHQTMDQKAIWVLGPPVSALRALLLFGYHPVELLAGCGDQMGCQGA